jgi:hypothetical protein
MSQHSTTHSTEQYVEPEHHNRWVYWGAWIVLGVFVVIGLFTFSSASSSRKANDKAEQLIAALDKAGARTPDKDQIVRVLGSDGGLVCHDPAAALSKATFYSQLMNGAAGPGMRPVVADSQIFKGQLLIMNIYCPDKLDDVKSYVDDLKSDDVVKQ